MVSHVGFAQDMEVEEEDVPASEASTSQSAFKLPGAFDGMAIGVSGGYSIFQGDIASYERFPKPGDMSESVEFGWALSLYREIKYGLGAELQFHKGKLKGERGQLLDDNAHYIFDAEYYDVSLGLNYDLIQLLTKKKKRFALNSQLGVGMVAFRAAAIKVNSGLRVGAVGYKPQEESEGQLLVEKDKREVKAIIPVGLELVYRVNYKADLTFTMNMRNTTTDKMDAWVRDWTANDKYTYVGVGLRFNFNRSEADEPEKSSKGASNDVQSIGSSASSKEKSGGSKSKSGGLFSRKESSSSSRSRSSESDDLLELRLKLYETQLKLFEMQYLLNGK